MNNVAIEPKIQPSQSNARLERRSAERVKLSVPVVAIPVEDQCSKLEKQIIGHTKDISDTGVGFFCDAPLDCELVTLRFCASEKDEIVMRARVVRRVVDGHQFLIGCEFV